MNGAIVDAADIILARHDLTTEIRYPWVHVGNASRREGWKLHLSCRPLDIAALAGHLAAAHRDTGVPFKIIATLLLAELLNEGGFGDTQIGKCATVYPRHDAEFAALAARFAEIDDLHGPRVPNDLRLGQAVYARYGGFNPEVERDLLGQTHLTIRDLDGCIVRDDYDLSIVRQRFARCFNAPPWKDRFCLWPDATLPSSGQWLNSRYLIIDVLRSSAKGPLFQAIDTSDRSKVRPVIIKMGRAQVLSDRFGRDIRSRLKAQARWHAVTSPMELAPACDQYFEVEGDGFLPIAFQSGDNLEARVQSDLGGRTLDAAAPHVRQQLLRILEALCGKVSALHGLNLVHRDLSPSNILLDAKDAPVLSDLEIAAPIGAERLFGKGTPGFMAPEQAAGGSADPRADVRAFAAIILYSLTGLDPRRLPMSGRGALTALRLLARSIPKALWDAVEAGLAPMPEDRPSLADLQRCLAAAKESTGESGTPVARPQMRQVAVAGLHSLASPALLLDTMD